MAGEIGDCPPRHGRITRREALKYGAVGLACLSAGGLPGCSASLPTEEAASAEVFKDDAPKGELWELWQKRGWAKEARHYLKLGRKAHCRICPNKCLLEPEDRGHCRNRVNKDGILYTMAYGNPCTFHVDPIEKKPLFHFLPGTEAFSIATSGCVFRCLNCQNWEISQRKPEETKDPHGEPVRVTPQDASSLTRLDVERLSRFLEMDRLTMLPEDVVALAERAGSRSIAYTYSEPIAYYEYTFDTSRLAREKNIKNLWITCGSIQEEALVDLCKVIDAANVNLKSFDEGIYERLNAGKLEPILNTLQTLKREGVWFEVTNLVVPTYTDELDMIRRMCDWLVAKLGPDCPLHFSRFHPQHKLTNLPPTPVEVLVQARSIARDCGLRYVYIGNVRDVEDAETTFCPGCGKAVVQRVGFFIEAMNVVAGQCRFCATKIAGVWTA